MYPIVFIAEGISASNPSLNMAWFNVLSSAANIVNKAGFGITAYLAVKAVSGGDQKGAERLPESAASWT